MMSTSQLSDPRLRVSGLFSSHTSMMIDVFLLARIFETPEGQMQETFLHQIPLVLSCICILVSETDWIVTVSVKSRRGYQR